MSKSEVPDTPPEIIEFRIEWRLDATVTLNGENWVKPGASTSIKWRDIPSDEMIKGATKLAVNAILEPVLEDVMVMVTKKATEIRG